MSITRVSQVKNDLLSGLTVSLALVPEAVAFSFVAGVDPLVGMYAAFMVGLITAIFGRPGMISGATGAMAVVMVALVAQHGVQYLFAAVILAGLLQGLAGLLKLGRFIRIVPHPVMLGFVNGLAIVIFLAQLNQFKVPGVDGALTWLTGTSMATMCALVALTMAIVYFLPKLTKAVPSSLVAIVGVSALAIFFGLDARTVGDVASVSGGWPSFAIPSVPFTMETFQIILPYSVILAAVGLIESLLTLSLIDEMTNTRGHASRECLAQGAANVVTGFIGGMGGCAMIGQSMINISSGGRGRLSGITAAVALLMIILFASRWIEMIPLAALTGVMFMVVIGTFEWSSFRIIRRIPAMDAFVIVLVSAVTVFTDLAVAVLVGVVVSALHFAWTHASNLHIQVERRDDQKLYQVHGSLFFASVTEFLDIFDASRDPDLVIVDFKNSKVCDHSGLEAIDTLAGRYRKLGKELQLHNLSADCQRILERAGHVVGIAKPDTV